MCAREPGLQQSASSDNLIAGIRPRGVRRRSTIWAASMPGYRQKKLEDVIEGGLMDTFFSLHCERETEPIYISEVAEKAMVRSVLMSSPSRKRYVQNRHVLPFHVLENNQAISPSQTHEWEFRPIYNRDSHDHQLTSSSESKLHFLRS